MNEWESWKNHTIEIITTNIKYVCIYNRAYVRINIKWEQWFLIRLIYVCSPLAFVSFLFTWLFLFAQMSECGRECGEKRNYVNEIYGIRFSVHIWMTLYRCLKKKTHTPFRIHFSLHCMHYRLHVRWLSHRISHWKKKFKFITNAYQNWALVRYLQQSVHAMHFTTLAKIDSCAPTPPKTFVLHAPKADAGNDERTDRARYRSMLLHRSKLVRWIYFGRMPCSKKYFEFESKKQSLRMERTKWNGNEYFIETKCDEKKTLVNYVCSTVMYAT